MIIISLELQTLIKTIEELRSNLNSLILRKGNLRHPEVIRASKDLDDALNKYQKLIESIM
ncbi:Spo0E family sporulation regulatory protein-aspartic acid phosphatase [Sporosalibacterium faouarense]|uniref:Spo0E family sporulation regulatory protein-aspartic acid phosphatase n=1 Tax=Sporosalibacterium faouarense TaxID=516123 RepID=UPI003C75BDA8